MVTLSDLTLYGSIAVLAFTGIYFWPQITGRGKLNPVLVFMRLQPSSEDSGGQDMFVKAKKVKAAAQEPQYALPTGEKVTVMKEKEGYNETVYVPKKITLKKGFHKVFFWEKGNLVKLSQDLADTSTLMMNNEDISKVNSRTTTKKLALSLTSGIGDHLIYILLGLALGGMVAFFAYPEVVHQTPVYIYCVRQLNGTTIPVSVCPQT